MPSVERKKKLGDYILVEMAKGVSPVPIYKKDLSEEEWNQVKETAKTKGTLVQDTEGLEAPSAEDRSRIERMSQKMEKARIEKARREESPDLQDLQPQTSVEGGSTPLARAAAMVQRAAAGALPADELQDLNKKINKISSEAMKALPGGPSKPKTRMMPEVDIRPDRVLPELDISTDPAESLKQIVRENEAAAQVKKGLDFTTPESRLAATVNERSKQPPSYQEVTDNNDTEVSPTITDNDDTTVSPIAKPLQFGKDSLSTAAASEGLDTAPAPEETPIDFEGVSGGGPNAVERFLLPKTTALAEYQEGDAPPTTSPTAPPTAQPDVPPLAATAGGASGPGIPPPGPGGSFSVNTNRTPGVRPPPTGDADFFKAERESMERASRLEKDAIDEQARIRTKQNEAEREALRQKIEFTAKNEQDRLNAQNTYEESLRQGEMALNAIIDERRALMNTKVDNNAFYTKGGVGSAVMSTISGALFGWTGQGMQFLQRMDSLAQQEVKNQQDELARRSGELGAMADEKRNVIALARARGLSAVESVAAARVSFFQGVQDQLAKAAADNPQFQAIADQKIAELEMGKARDLVALKQAGQAEAHRKVLEQQGWARLAREREEMSIRSAEGRSGGQPLKPQQTARLSEIFNSAKQMADMMKNYREKTGAFSGLTQFAPAGSTDAAKWRQARRGYAKSIGRGIEGGKMTDKDEDSILESYIPTGEDVEGNVNFKGQRLAKYAADKYRSELEALAGGDYRTHGLPSPEQFEEYLLLQMGLSTPPAYATPRN